MNRKDQQPSSSTLAALLKLRECIEEESLYLKVLEVYTQPRPFLKVKDTFHGIVVGFTCEAEYRTYVALVWQVEVPSHV